MKKNTLNIQFSCEDFLLNGVLHLPTIENPPIVIGSHGLEGSKESGKQKVLAKLLVKKDIAFFRFDHRGCGHSQGDFITDTSLAKRTQDFICAVSHILQLGKTSKNLAIFGSSMGGATCINAWQKLMKMDLNLCGAVICSAPVKSRTIENIPTEANEIRPALPISFFEKNLLFDLSDQLHALTNVQIFHGDADDVVPVSNGHDIFEQAKDPKQLFIHKGEGHQMASKTNQQHFEKEAANWFLDCFSRADQAAP